jgi:DNA-directed RNA polymerase sigma subunit (sigma70/sigma32)
METVAEYQRDVEKWHQFLLERTNWSEKRERNAGIVRDYLTTDASYQELGERYGICSQRCREMLQKALRLIRSRLKSQERMKEMGF